MNIKKHRVVLGASAFQRIARMLSERAVECAENEGWPIPADAIELPRVMAQAGAMRRGTTLFHQHVKDELHFWSGRTEAQRRTKALGALLPLSPPRLVSAHVVP